MDVIRNNIQIPTIMTPDFNKLSKKELVNILTKVHSNLTGIGEEARTSSLQYGENGRPNYVYAFGYISARVENVMITLNNIG